jgi:hypothetical protein
MTPVIATLLTFLAVLMAVVSFAFAVEPTSTRRSRSKLSRRLDEEFHRKQRDKVQKSVLFKDLHKLAAEPFGKRARPAKDLAGKTRTAARAIRPRLDGDASWWRSPIGGGISDSRCWEYSG